MPSTTDTTEPWLKYLQDDFYLTYTWENSSQRVFNAAIIKYLSSKNSSPSPEDTALEIDSIYLGKFLEENAWYDAISREGMEDYLTTLYNTVFAVSRALPYSDPKQQKLVELLVALSHLPVGEFSTEAGTFHDYVHNSVFVGVREEKWNQFWTSNSSPRWQATRIGWINFSAFIARCIAAGLDDDPKYGCKPPDRDIPCGLEPEKNLEPEIAETYVMVAALYLSLAPEMLYKVFVTTETPERREKYVEKWRVWAKKLAELELHYEGAEKEKRELLKYIRIARKNVLEVGKELFVDDMDAKNPKETTTKYQEDDSLTKESNNDSSVENGFSAMAKIIGKEEVHVKLDTADLFGAGPRSPGYDANARETDSGDLPSRSVTQQTNVGATVPDSGLNIRPDSNQIPLEGDE